MYAKRLYVGHPRLLNRSATPANESVRPAQAPKVVATPGLGPESVVQFFKLARVINARAWAALFHGTKALSSRTCVKGIPINFTIGKRHSLFTSRLCMRTALVILCSMLFAGCAATSQRQGTPLGERLKAQPAQEPGALTSQRQGTPLGERLRVPVGFAVETLTTQVPNARAMAEGPRGTVFVGSYAAGNVYALTLDQGRVTKVRTLLKELANPTSIALRDGALYVATTTKVLRYDDIENRLDAPPAPVAVIDGLLNQGTHAARYIGFGPEGKLYLNLSAPCDLCEPKADEFAIIIRTNPDGSGREVVARGVRNTGGFDWHPRSSELWFTQTETDALDDSRVSDQLSYVSQTGQHFGFPYCQCGDVKNPKYGHKRSCTEFVPPVVKLGARYTPLGMRFYKAGAFPPDFNNNILVARHGSYGLPRVGYDVVRVILDGRNNPRIEPFIEGFLDEDKNVLGRPVGVLILRDGSVLISDDHNGAIYRVRYTGQIRYESSEAKVPPNE